jgi:hypothetical protein
MTPEVIEADPCAAPPPRKGPEGQGRKQFDLDSVKAWLEENPGQWCRLVGANERPFSLREVNAIRGSLSSLWLEGRGSRSVSIQTRASGAGKAIYARRETDEEHEAYWSRRGGEPGGSAARMNT